jgi:hypothetical protein
MRRIEIQRSRSRDPCLKAQAVGRWRAAKLQHLPFFAVDWRVLPMTAYNFRDILMRSRYSEPFLR